MLNHIQGIKITEKYKGILNELDLSNLGRINTICGKNNSGKSSLIESINALKNMVRKHLIERYLFTYNDELIQLIIQYIKDISTGRGYSPGYDDKLLTIFSTKKNVTYPFSYWFRTHFQNAFGPIVTKNFSGGYVNDFTNDMQKFFNQWLSKIKFKPRLIPAKRNLPTATPITIDSEYQSDGKGLINHLFHMKNQDIGSDEFEKYKKIHDVFIKITNVRFNITTQPEHEELPLILKFFRHKDIGWLPSHEWGQGLIDILIILSFAIGFDDDPILIEEPENHIHPEMQRELLNYLKNETEKQYFFTTHSNVFLDPSLVDRIIYTEMKESVYIHDVMPRAEMLKNLGYSITENICADLFIIVEGPSDEQVFSYLLYECLAIPKKYHISFFYFGGDTMQYFPLDEFLGMTSSDKIFVIVDRDSSSSRSRSKCKKRCEELNIEFTQLKRYAIENYLTVPAVKQFYEKNPTHIPEKIEIPRDKRIDFTIGKNAVCKIFKLMELEKSENFKQTEDLYDFCLKIKAKLES